MQTVREAEILALGIVRVSPIPRRITPNTLANVILLEGLTN
jgi:hypothetical protein